MKKGILKILLVAVFALATLPSVANAGTLFVTGHDSDEHFNANYIAAGLDYLNFGTASNAGARSGYTVAYLNNGAYDLAATINGTGYSATTFNVTAGGFDWNTVFNGGFDAIITGSGNAGNLNTALLSQTAAFETYFNNGGGLYVNTDEDFGQTWYDFIPSFGTAVNNSISVAGAFTPTAAGLAIGLTDAVVDADITHSYYLNVDTNIFTVFETYDRIDPNPAVAFGFRGRIQCDPQDPQGNCFIPEDGNPVPEPMTMVLFGSGLVGTIISRRKKA